MQQLEAQRQQVRASILSQMGAPQGAPQPVYANEPRYPSSSLPPIDGSAAGTNHPVRENVTYDLPASASCAWPMRCCLASQVRLFVAHLVSVCPACCDDQLLAAIIYSLSRCCAIPVMAVESHARDACRMCVRPRGFCCWGSDLKQLYPSQDPEIWGLACCLLSRTGAQLICPSSSTRATNSSHRWGCHNVKSCIFCGEEHFDCTPAFRAHGTASSCAAVS